MASGVFITGTDTGVGKTHFSSLLVRALRSHGIDAIGVKPFCCGDRLDADKLHAASDGVLSLAEVNPVWLRVPASPYTASLVENRPLDVATAADTIKTLSGRHAFLVVEGVGGWRVPLTRELCMSQFASALKFPVVLVAANRLGAINHTQLTLDSIRTSGAESSGVVLNQPESSSEDAATITNRGVLEDLLSVPILGEIAYQCAELPAGLLERVLPLTR